MITDTIDATDLKETGDDLKLAIANAVADTQRLVVRPLPHKLIITPAQYDILQHEPNLKLLYGSKDYLYATPHNVMEVTIKED